MRYRRAKLNEADKISKLLVNCFNISSVKEGRETFLHERKKDVFIVAEENDKFYGLISWDVHGLPKHQLIKIERICVLAGPNRNEVAEELLRTAIQDADKFFKKRKLKLRKIYTLVHSSNTKLKNFYKKMGFIQEAKLKDHFYKGIDDFMLSMFFE